MKKLILFSVFILKISVSINAQSIGHQRGLYINRFVEIDNAGNIVPANTILGNVVKEDEILKYCMENHFTYITLYGLSRLFDANGNFKIGWDVKLNDFICKAKSTYCIEYVGGVIVDNESDVPSALRITGPISFTNAFKQDTVLYPLLQYLEDTIPTDDERFTNAEAIKLSLRLMGDFVNNGYTPNMTCSDGHLDVLSVEYEFWNNEYYIRSNQNDDFIELTSELDGIRDMHNSISGNSICYVEVYLQELFDSHPPAFPTPPIPACEIAQFIDYEYYDANNNPHPRYDRILGANYDPNENELYNPPLPNPLPVVRGGRHIREYSDRFLLFCEVNEAYPALTYNNLNSCAPNFPTTYPTLNNTNYQPIFHAGRLSQGALGDFLGSTIPLAVTRNIFTAERQYYDDFRNDVNHTNIHDSNEGNDLAPAGVQWFAQSFMTKPLNHPITFLAYNKSCNVGMSQTISLEYQGPIEAGISYSYMVTDCETGTVIAAPTSASGTTPNYTGVTTTAYPYSTVDFTLAPGNYCISLNLNYSTGCGYTYTQKIIVSNDFHIQSVNQPGNAEGPFKLCVGEYLHLQANINAPGATYQWFRNGILLPNETSFTYTASLGGEYFCVLAGTCSATSNVIVVNGEELAQRTIAATCTTNAVIFTVFPTVISDSYSWSNGSNTSSISVPLSNATYSVNITTANGCVLNRTHDVTTGMTGTNASIPILNTYNPDINITSPISGPFCPGQEIRIRPIANLVSGLTAIAWNTGATINPTNRPRIFVSNAGNYELLLRDDATGCELISSLTPNYLTPPLVSISPENPTICGSANQLNLTANAIGATSYAWITPIGGSITCLSSPCSSAVASIGAGPITNYSIDVGYNTSCHIYAATNILKLANCEKLTKTVNPTRQYATLPVTYMVSVCNDDFSGGNNHTYTLYDNPSIGVNINTIFQNPFNNTSWPINTLQTPILQVGQCASYKVICSYNDIGENCNDVQITEIDNVSVTVNPAEACINNLINCPMNVACRISGCQQNEHVSVQLRNHTLIQPELKYFKARLVYPNFLTPSAIGNYNPDPINNPNALSNPRVDFSSTTSSNLDIIKSSMTQPLPHSGSPGGYFVNYNYVDVEIHYTIPVLSPNILASFDFVFNANPPTGINSFRVFVVNPTNDEDNHTFLELVNGSKLSYWTQAVGSVIPSCPGIYGPDADFDITYSGCGGVVDVISHYAGNDYSSKWEFGDGAFGLGRTTPIFGVKDWTYDYYAPITTYTGPGGVQVPINPPIPAAAPGTYTITHTVYDGNNIASVVTKDVTILPSCCEMSPDITINEQGRASDYGNDLSDRIIFLNGILQIDQDFNLTNCNIIAATGSVIQVLDGVVFVFNNTHFFGCDGMWQGIIAGNSSQIISDYGSSISDAQTGITTPFPNGYLSITGCDFADNIVGIYSPENPDNAFYDLNFSILGNTFSSRGNFKADYPGQPPHGVFGKAGIEMNDLVGAIGNYGPYETNHFSQLNCGIKLTNCFMDIRNNDFTEIHSEDDEYYGSLGAAVMARGQGDGYYAVDVAPKQNQSLSDPTFYKCDKAVSTSNVALFVHENKMIDVGVGVEAAYTAHDLPIEVNANSIYAYYRGVLLSDNTGCHHMKIDNNYIKTDHPGGIGIDVSESGENMSVFLANGNSIYGIEHHAGIKAVNIDGLSFVQENVITTLMANGDETAGIELAACEGMTVSCNDIIGESASNNYYTYGIHQSICQKMNIHCNSTNNTYVGIEFDGVNPGTDFKTNEMNTHQEGLHLNSNAVIDAQVQAGNKWHGPFGNGGSPAYGAVNANTFGIYASPFYNDASSGVEYNPLIYPNSGWFGHQAGTPANCAEMEDCTRPNGDVEGAASRTMLDLEIANGNINTVDFTPESRNMAKHYLFEKLEENHALLSELAMQNFYTTHIISSVGKLSITKEDVKEMSSYTLSFKSTMRIADSLISFANDSLQLIDSLRRVSGNSAILEAAAISLHNRINLLHNTVKNIIAQREAMRNTELAAAEISNSNVVSNMIPEQNEKLLIDIHLTTDASGLHYYNATQESQLLSIAQQCPYSGGEAVYKARVKYLKLHPDAIFNDRATCLAEGIFRKANPKTEDDFETMQSSIHISIWPNPAKDNATIAYTAEGETGCQLQITDLAGKLIREINLPCKQNRFTFTTENLEAGFYVAKVLNNGTLLGKSKFGIVK